jgi:hypothetical protein
LLGRQTGPVTPSTRLTLCLPPAGNFDPSKSLSDVVLEISQ